MFQPKFGLLVAAICLGFASPAGACSMRADYRVPTNLELTADAELILLGTVESAPDNFDGLNQANMVVRPIAALKGQMPAGTIKLPGMLAPERFAVKSNAIELEQAHPLAYIGGCVRYMFVQNSTVLFFLKRFDGADVPPEMKGMLVPAGSSFSRWAEDVPSASAPWVRATRIYVSAASLPQEQQAAYLRAERDKLLVAGDPDSKRIAADIDRQLAGPNKPWNQLMDEEIKKMKERGEDPLEGFAKALGKGPKAVEKDK